MPDQDSSTRLIPLSKGKFAIVDAADFEWLNQWKWYAHLDNRSGRLYAQRTYQRRKTISMHREILATPLGLHTDHANGDGLDNRRSNLRIATRSQNGANSKRPKNNTSGFKGVVWSRGKWTAQMKVRGQSVYLGRFVDPQDAHAAYLKAAAKHFGEFARRATPVELRTKEEQQDI